MNLRRVPGRGLYAFDLYGIIENMPGAASMIAANRIYSMTKADGFTIGCINKGLPIAQMLKTKGAMFDLLKFSWIGSASTEQDV